MKKTEKVNYQQKTVSELQVLLASAKKKMVESRIKHTGGQLKDSSIFKKIKYEIALILTLISQKKHEKKQ